MMSNTDLPRISQPERASRLASVGRVILIVAALIAGALLGFR
jgi:hypothetical protein